MRMIRRSALRMRRAQALAFALAIVQFDALAQTMEDLLPPAATPGGAQPFLRENRLPALAQRDSLEIPPVVDRPLGLDKGPRVRVSRFELIGAIERNGVSAADVQAILDRHLAAQPADGYTINQLQLVADDLTLYYRNRGLILARAFVPAQTVENGVVSLQVIAGSLGGVAVEGNRIYSSDTILGPLTPLIGEPVDRDRIEEVLLTLQDFPGLTVFGTFRQGAALGETELLVSVREEQRVSITPVLDNYGSRYTGKVRGTLQMQFNNLAGMADRLSAYVLKTVDPSNGTYGGVSYELSTHTGRTSVGFGAARNRFDVTDARTAIDLDISGTVNTTNLYVRRQFANRRTFRADGTLELARKRSEIEQSVGANPRDDLNVLSYTFDYYTVGARQRGLNLGYVRAVVGDNDVPAPDPVVTGVLGGTERPSRQGGSGKYGTGSYTKLEFGYQRLQRLGNHHALLLKLDGQHSSDLLASLEQFAIGGPVNVRAYPVAEALVDSGGSATLEWIIDAPGFAERPVGQRLWGDIFKLSFYFDYAGGKINDPRLSQPKTLNFRGYGMGLQFSMSEKFFVRLDAAAPQGGTPSDDKDPRYYMSASFTF